MLGLKLNHVSKRGHWGHQATTWSNINLSSLTQWSHLNHICVSKLTIIGSDNGFSPDRRQAIIGTNAVILSIGPLQTSFSEIWSEIHIFSFQEMYLKIYLENADHFVPVPMCSDPIFKMFFQMLILALQALLPWENSLHLMVMWPEPRLPI